MSSTIGNKGLTSKPAFTQATQESSNISSGTFRDHQPLAAPAPRPKGMGASSIDRTIHNDRQTAMRENSEPKNKSKNSDVREKRAAKAFAMVASKNEGIESQRSKGR